MTKETQTKVNKRLKVLKIHVLLISEFLMQKKPHEYIIDTYDEECKKYTEAIDRIEELNFLIQETKIVNNIIKNIAFELID
jgi:hypothetical protein